MSGLRTEPLVQKALEGNTLGASGERIRSAVAAPFGQLAEARSALGTAASDAEVNAVADTLQRLRALRAGRSLVVPISVLTDLVAEGTPIDRVRIGNGQARRGRAVLERALGPLELPGLGPERSVLAKTGPVCAAGVGNLGWTWHERVSGTTTLEGELRAWAYPSQATAVWLGASVGDAWSLGEWRAPPGTRRLESEFGAEVGEIVVE